MPHSLRIRLTLSFIVLAIAPLLVVGGVLVWRAFTVQETQALALQSQTAQRVAANITSFLLERENELRFMIDLQRFDSLSLDEQARLLSDMLAYRRNVYQDLKLLDATGQETIRFSRQRLVLASDLQNWAGRPEFEMPKVSGDIYFSSVLIDDANIEPFMIIALPLTDLRSGKFIGVIMASFRFRTVWDLVSHQGGDSLIYLVDKQNMVIAHPDSSVVLRQTKFEPPATDGFYVGLDGANAAMSFSKIELHDQTFTVVVEQPATEALALAYSTIYVTVMVLIVSIILAAGLGALAIYWTVRPIEILTQTVKLISAGDMTQQVEIANQGEVGQLALAFNMMTRQLRELIDTLEYRVYQRTQRLETMATLSGDLNAILDMSTLLMELVHQVKQRFNYYHVHIYILDVAGEKLLMQAGVGEVGQQMKAAGHYISLHKETSLVAQAARSGKVVWVDDVHSTSGWLSNVLLPNTQAEMAVPIIVNQQVMGVLDVQSDKVAGLDEGDANLLRSLANHLAVAMTNARLFAQNQATLRETETLYTISQRMLVATNLTQLITAMVEEAPIEVINRVVLFTFEYNERGHMVAITGQANWSSGQGMLPTPIGTRYLRTEVPILNLFVTEIPVMFTDTLHDETLDVATLAIAQRLNIRSMAVLPLWSQGRQLGVLLLEGEEPHVFSEQEIRPYQAMLGQLSVAVENQHLLLQTLQAKEEADQARTRAEVANQAKSDFLSAMSHELRTPLNGILGYAQILRRKPELSQDMATGLNIIYQSGNHLLTLINDILDLSKVEARKMELHTETVELTSFLGSVVGIIYMRAREKGVEFKQEFKSLPPGVMVDEKRLRQVLLNLLGNAVKFTAQGAVTLRVSQIVAHEQQVLLRFEVEDSGVGIAADGLEKIFLPFEQTGGIKQRAEGTGLGLTISRQLVELMGGTIQVKSQLGRGSLFWFELNLPLGVVSQSAAKVVQGSSEILGYEGERRRVLLVDDKASNRYVLQALLEPLGFEIAEAEDGAAAFELTLQFRPDLIITDVVMPQMTGFELIEKVRAMPDLAAIHIIVVSASSFDLREKANAVTNYDGYLSKPIDMDKLLELIRQSLALEWLYKTEIVKAETVIEAMLPQAELVELHQYVKQGNMRKVRLKGEALLNEVAAEYHPFIKQVLELARGYEEKKLRVLLEQYL